MRLSCKSLLLAATVLPMIQGVASAQTAQPTQDTPSTDGQSADSHLDDDADGSTQTTISGDPEQIAAERAKALKEAPSGDQADIEVTGSRLSDGDVTAQKIIIDRAQIKARGVTSVEDLIRTLPQNVNTIGAITNERTRGPLSLRPRGASVSELGTLGVSAANLGGTGAGNTLVLINGRRMAGAAGIEDGFVNLNGIPLSAIERVEILPSGSAAIYGADALSGVINFILRKDAKGLTLGSQALKSSAGADNARFNAYGAYSWGSGRISATADYQKIYPIVNSRTGYVTDDYSSYFDGDPQYDFRSFQSGLQPGVIEQTQFIFDPVTSNTTVIRQGLTVRPGLSRPPTQADFVTVGREALRDFIPRLAGPQSETVSFTGNIDQKITDRLSVYVQGLYSRAKNRLEGDIGQGLTVRLGVGQAYNPFPAFGTGGTAETFVSYYPAAEVAAGIITPRVLRNTATSWSVNAGATYDVNKDTRLSLIYTTSQSTSTGSGVRMGSVVDFTTLPDGTRGCVNDELSRSQISAARRAVLQPVFDRQCRALTSADPAVAFNPFRSDVNAPGGGISDFLYNDAREDRSSRLSQYEARLTGSLLTLPAGKLTYAVGGEYITDGADSSEINLVTGTAGSRDRYAAFGELSLPILGKGYDLPLMRTLTFNLAARRDTFKTSGAIGTVNNVPVAQGGELVFGENTFNRVTPSFGVRYQPVGQLTFLAKWGRGFQPPPYTQLFNPAGTEQSFATIIGDPYYNCAANRDCLRNDPARGYLVPLVTAPNVNLRPQTSRQESFTASWRPTGFLDNLSIDATFNRTVIRNEFGRLDDINQLLTRTEAYSLSQFYARNANGKVTQVNASVFNLVASTYSSMTYEVAYSLMTDIGNFEPRVVVVDNLKAERQVLPTTQPLSRVGTIQGPDDYRVVGSLGYFRDHVTLTLWAYHTPSYLNDYDASINAGIRNVTPNLRKVDSYTTFDLTGSWNTNHKVRFNFAIRNLFNPKPPFALVQNRPYDTARYNAAGRTGMIQMEYNF